MAAGDFLAPEPLPGGGAPAALPGGEALGGGEDLAGEGLAGEGLAGEGLAGEAFVRGGLAALLPPLVAAGARRAAPPVTVV